jgi:hypothetical protein
LRERQGEIRPVDGPALDQEVAALEPLELDARVARPWWTAGRPGRAMRWSSVAIGTVLPRTARDEDEFSAGPVGGIADVVDDKALVEEQGARPAAEIQHAMGTELLCYTRRRYAAKPGKQPHQARV